MDLGLKGKVALVTGGTRGLGQGIAAGLVREGVSVVIGDISTIEIQDKAAQAADAGEQILSVKTDVSKKTDVEKLVQTAVDTFGKIDILVNAAGTIRDNRFLEIEEEEWDLILDTNLKGIYLVTKAAVPHMISRREGKIVNISSRSGKDAQAGLSHYGASKFGILGLTQALAKELAEYNINVNAVCPGVIRTEMWEKILDTRSQREGVPKSEIYSRVIESIPLGRPQLPDDVANVVLFLCSEAARNITGEAINVNGGMRMD